MPPQPITSTQANQEARCMPPNTYSSQRFGLLRGWSGAYATNRDTIAVGACQKLIQSGTSKNAYDMCIYIYITTSFCEIIEVRDQETYDLNGIPERSYAADVFFHSLPP